MGWAGMDLTDLAQDMDQCAHSNGPSGSIKCWEILE
jgi:hypothetical protein